MDKPHVPHSLGTNGTRHVTHSAGTKYALDITHSVGSFICLLRSQLSFFFKLYTFHHSDFSACLRPLPQSKTLNILWSHVPQIHFAGKFWGLLHVICLYWIQSMCNFLLYVEWSHLYYNLYPIHMRKASKYNDGKADKIQKAKPSQAKPKC